MTRTCVAAAAALALILGTVEASAQEWSAFLTGGGECTVRPIVPKAVDCWPLVRGGALVNVGTSRLRVGAQGDLMVSLPYAAGRGGPIAQVNIRQARRTQVFAYAGYVFGEDPQPVLGAGLDVWTGQRRGLRIALQDGFQQQPRFCLRPTDCISARIDHTLSGVIGIVWR